MLVSLHTGFPDRQNNKKSWEEKQFAEGKSSGTDLASYCFLSDDSKS